MSVEACAHITGTYRGMSRVAVTQLAVRFECPSCGRRQVEVRCLGVRRDGARCEGVSRPTALTCRRHHDQDPEVPG